MRQHSKKWQRDERQFSISKQRHIGIVIQGSDSLPLSPLWGHLVMSGDIFGSHQGGWMVMASSEQGLKALEGASRLHRTDRQPRDKNWAGPQGLQR